MTFKIWGSQPSWIGLRFTAVIGDDDVYFIGETSHILINGVHPHGKYTRKSYDHCLEVINSWRAP